jgi:hypothetical protein
MSGEMAVLLKYLLSTGCWIEKRKGRAILPSGQAVGIAKPMVWKL